jgi:hypothetical protein
MSQPVWKEIANLGDVDPIDHDGYFVFVDETGVYPAEAERLESPPDDGDMWDDETGDYSNSARWIVHRFSLDRCTFTDGVLSDNRFHPDHPAWFADDLESAASCMDFGEPDLRTAFCSDDPIRRANAYRAVGDYHGFDNLDSYPLTLSRDEVKSRYPQYV